GRHIGTIRSTLIFPLSSSSHVSAEAITLDPSGALSVLTSYMISAFRSSPWRRLRWGLPGTTCLANCKAPWARLCTGRCQSGLRHYGTALPRHVATYRIEVVIRPRLEV